MLFESSLGTIQLFILTLALAYAAFTDTQRMEIPVFLFPVSCGAIGICKLFLYGTSDFPISDVLLGMAVLAVPFIIGAFFNVCGGGDILMFAAVGFTIGLSNMFWYAAAMIISGLVICLYYIMKRIIKTHKLKGMLKMHIPMAPIALTAFVIFVLGGYYYVYK